MSPSIHAQDLAVRYMVPTLTDTAHHHVNCHPSRREPIDDPLLAAVHEPLGISRGMTPSCLGEYTMHPE